MSLVKEAIHKLHGRNHRNDAGGAVISEANTPHKSVDLLTLDELNHQLDICSKLLGEEFDDAGRDPYLVAQAHAGSYFVSVDRLFQRAEKEGIPVQKELKGIIKAGFEIHREEIEKDPNLSPPHKSRLTLFRRYN